MKKDIHPEKYRPVVFRDTSNGDEFLIQSCAPTKDTTSFEGALLTDPDKSQGIILCRPGVPGGRRRFTIGHELGHFLAAKSIGVRVEKFYLGFNLFGLGLKRKFKGTEYGIGLFPLGGYVKVAGIIDESMDTESTGGPDEFRSKSTLGKIWIMSAGVMMNFVLAILIISHLTYHNGVNEPDPRAIIGQIMSEYPAASLGLQKGDQILSIDGIPITKIKNTKKSNLFILHKTNPS